MDLMASAALAEQLPEAGGLTAKLGAPHYYGVAIFAGLLVIAHVMAPWIRSRLQGRAMLVASLGGGMAVAYVFLHLLPELDEGHGLLGELIFAVPLAGFLLQYLVRRQADRMGSASASSSTSFSAKITNLSVYNWLILYGAPAGHAEVSLHSIPMFVAILLHLVHRDYTLGSEYPSRFDRIGRWLLVVASIAGYLTIVFLRRTNEELNMILVAVLAGSILYSVFSEEVPDDRKVRFRWFLLGVLAFSATVALSMAW